MTQRPADAAASSFGARLRRAGVKTLRLRVSGERAKRGLESDNESGDVGWIARNSRRSTETEA